MQHKDIPLGDIHYVHNWEVANAAARAALTPVATDKGKLVWQTDTNEFFFLANHVGPVWVGTLGVSGPTGPRGFSVLNGIVAPVAGDGVNGDFFLNTATSTIYGPKAAEVWPAGVSLVGAAGSNGANGTNGVGVPVGGAINYVLKKASAADYDTAWAAATGAGTTVSATAPVTPTNGQGWFDTNTGITYTWVDDGDSSAWVEGGPVAPKPAGRELLTAARTYYVATTGADTNDGLTVGAPFLTIQKAIDVVCSTLDMSIHQVTIQLADGTYTTGGILKKYLGALAPIINGNATTPANVHVNDAVAGHSSFTFLNVFGDNTTYSTGVGTWVIQNMKLTAARACLETYGTGNVIKCGAGLIFGVATFHLLASAAGTIILTTSYSISGSANYHILSQQASAVFNSVNLTVTLLASITVTYFVYCLRNAIISMSGVTYTLGAFTVTGQRYQGQETGAIYTGTVATATYFPGTVAGVIATDGHYS